MKTEQIVMCVIALALGMLVANMLTNVCGCKTRTEGFDNSGYVFPSNIRNGSAWTTGYSGCFDNKSLCDLDIVNGEIQTTSEDGIGLDNLRGNISCGTLNVGFGGNARNTFNGNGLQTHLNIITDNCPTGTPANPAPPPPPPCSADVMTNPNVCQNFPESCTWCDEKCVDNGTCDPYETRQCWRYPDYEWQPCSEGSGCIDTGNPGKPYTCPP